MWDDDRYMYNYYFYENKTKNYHRLYLHNLNTSFTMPINIYNDPRLKTSLNDVFIINYSNIRQYGQLIVSQYFTFIFSSEGAMAGFSAVDEICHCVQLSVVAWTVKNDFMNFLAGEKENRIIINIWSVADNGHRNRQTDIQTERHRHIDRKARSAMVWPIERLAY